MSDRPRRLRRAVTSVVAAAVAIVLASAEPVAAIETEDLRVTAAGPAADGDVWHFTETATDGYLLVENLTGEEVTVALQARDATVDGRSVTLAGTSTKVKVVEQVTIPGNGSVEVPVRVARGTDLPEVVVVTAVLDNDHSVRTQLGVAAYLPDSLPGTGQSFTLLTAIAAALIVVTATATERARRQGRASLMSV